MKKIILPSISIMVTEACSLKCKLCLAFVPYYKQHFHMNLQETKEVLNYLFQIVDQIDKLSITGGEPLLNPDLCAIVEEIFQYSDKISQEIILITNGTIKISDKIIDILKLNRKVKVIVNNYGELSTYAEENYMKLIQNNINTTLYTEDNRYGWIDCRNHELKHMTKEACQNQSSRCAFFQGKKYVINRGVLYTCTRAAYRIQENIIECMEDDFINLLEKNAGLDIMRAKLEKLLKAETTVSCAYCDGLTEQSVKYKAAEQL